MKTARWSGVAAILSLMIWAHAARGQESPPVTRQRLSLDSHWRFTLNDPADAATQFDYPEVRDLAKAQPAATTQEAALAAQRPDPLAINLGAAVSFVQSNFDDAAWRELDLPHDWAVELPFDQAGNNGHGSKKIGPTLGNTIGWYRREFDLPADDKGHALWVEFDGVYRNSLVWLNGHCLGRNVSGYASFWYDISKAANFGGSNELVVRVDATRTEGWFYEGAGIYRHVWLVRTGPVHVAHWGTYVTSNVWGRNAAVTARATIRDDSDAPRQCEVNETVFDAEGHAVSESSEPHVKLEPGAEHEVAMVLPVIYDAKLWSIETPYLYKLVTTVRDDTGVLDRYETTFGVRTLRFDPDHGFFLNGNHVEIDGTCNHQDHAGVGVALPDALQVFRVGKLKEMGSNAYRTSHNDPTPELLDACDRMGMLVMDEHREMGMSPEITSQLQRLILRDRNHPSVFIWSIGNEEGAIQGNNYGIQIATYMQNIVHALDPTRPCSEAMNSNWGRGLSNVIDIQGYNYLKQGGGGGRRAAQPGRYTAMDDFHAAFPNTPSIGTEEASTLATRGEYANDSSHSYMSAYDVNTPGWGTTAEQWWTYYSARPWVAGAFVWTGFDYRGEPTPYHWPAVSSQFGVMDTCGFPKDDFFYYQAWWTKQPVLHLLPHWNWPGKEGQPIDVRCFSNFESVELSLNGKSLGRQTMPVNSHLAWKVPYQPGTLEARGYNGDQLMATTKVETTGAAAKVILTPDRAAIKADGRDVAVVTVSVTDAQGRVVPLADNLVKFAISGGKILGVGNGDPGSHEPDQVHERHAFCGLCQVLVQSTTQSGAIQLTATADGLAPATLAIDTQATPPVLAVP